MIKHFCHSILFSRFINSDLEKSKIFKLNNFMIIYTDFMPLRFDGFNLGLITLIRPSLKDDIGIHVHESVHRKQFIRNPFMGLFYIFSKKHKLKYELEAYREQLRFEPGAESLFAYFLANNYGLDITKEEALKLLTS